MTRLERFRADRDLLLAQINQYTRQSRLAPPKMVEKLNDLNAAIEEIEENERPRPIIELLTKEQLRESGIIDLITEIHLASDFIAQRLYDFTDRCHAYGIEIDCVEKPAKEIIKQIDSFVNPLMVKNEWLENAMVCNEYLLEAIHKKIQSFIDQRKPKLA